MKYIEKLNIIFENQFGFRSGYSTVQAVTRITDKIQKAIENKQYSCGIFLDLSKAFDTVNHDILITKLEHYGIRGIAKDWFKSYLFNRKQYVSIRGVNSDVEHISCGVPQGSVLGPLLFLLYINDFGNCSDLFDFHLFADDANLFFSHDNLLRLEELINYNLIKVQSWLSANRLCLNIDKTNYVIFHTPQKLITHNLKLHINCVDIKQASFVKYLGIHIDSHLNWKTQVHNILKKIQRSIGILSKLRYYVTSKILLQLYYSLIYPFLTYGIVVWGNTYESSLKPLVLLQKRVVRVITFSSYDEHTSPLFKNLGLLKLFDIIRMSNLLFMHDFYKKKLPTVFNDFFLPICDSHKFATRLAVKISYCMPIVRTNYGKFSIRSKGPHIWNEVDDSLKTLTKSVFKKKIKVKFISEY
jgi:hypothetical protein